MKLKYLILSALVFLSVCFVSCRKVYTCSCNVDGETIVTTFNQEHKQTVENSCDQMEKSARIEDKSATCKVEESLNQQP